MAEATTTLTIDTAEAKAALEDLLRLTDELQGKVGTSSAFASFPVIRL